MLQSELKKQYPNIVKDGFIFTAEYTYSKINPILDEIGNVVDYELVDFVLVKTPEEVYKTKPISKNLTELEEVKKRVSKLINGQLKLERKSKDFEESQDVQNMLIDDIVFEVIPSLEQQINLSNEKSDEIVQILINNKKENGVNAMAGYLAQKIIDGRDYATVFKTKVYKQYQDEVDTILELEGRGDLIKRHIV